MSLSNELPGLQVRRHKRYSRQEKMQIIRWVENSNTGVNKSLQELNINKSTYYKWYNQFLKDGEDGLSFKYKRPEQFWNAIPPEERKRVIDTALAHSDMSSKELAWYITDSTGNYISESSVYRILKEKGMVAQEARKNHFKSAEVSTKEAELKTIQQFQVISKPANADKNQNHVKQNLLRGEIKQHTINLRKLRHKFSKQRKQVNQSASNNLNDDNLSTLI